VTTKSVPALAAAAAAAAAVAAGCGWLPADAPPPQRPAGDPDVAALVHTWRVDAHLLASGTSMSDADAAQHHGRTLAVRASGYTTPWHGTCEESGRVRRERALADVSVELGFDRARAAALGLADPLFEYKLSCADLEKRAPSLTLYVAAARAMTCFGGVCYVLAR
jgi:hypothetical protein